MIRRVLLPFFILLCLASCGIFKSTGGRISYGDNAVSAHFPRRVAVELCQTDPSLKLEMIEVISKNIGDAGIEVVNPGGPHGTACICGGGTLSEDMRRDLRDNSNIDGLFVGTLDQRRVEPLLLTRFELRLIGNPGGRLMWATTAKMDQLAAWADTRTSAARTIQLALEAFKKDYFSELKGTKEKSEKERKKRE